MKQKDRKHIAIVGGGFGGITAARALTKANADITLIDRLNHHLFQPLLYQVATAALSPGDVAAPIRASVGKRKGLRVFGEWILYYFTFKCDVRLITDRFGCRHHRGRKRMIRDCMNLLTKFFSASNEVDSSPAEDKTVRSDSGFEKAIIAPVRILFGTTTGNSEMLADETAEKLKEIGLSAGISGMGDFDPDELYQVETLLVIVSTDNDGDPPYMAENLYNFLDQKAEADLNHLSFSVLALGDSYYPDFCQAGKDFDRMLEKLGANRICERVDCDIDFWKGFDIWVDKALSVLIENKKVVSY